MPGKTTDQNPASMETDPRVNDDDSVSVTTSSDVSLPDEGFQWETVHTEAPTQITFDNVGDTFIGLYIGKETVEFEVKTGKNKGDMEEFTQLSFLVKDEPYAINAGYDLLRGFKNIPENTYVRIQLRKMVDVGQQSPLKSYRVDIARPPKEDQPPVKSSRANAEDIARRVTGARDASNVTPDGQDVKAPF
jgi:hypothetical protein